MPRNVTVSGIEGSLRWGYHPAGALRDWTVTRTDDTWALTATVVQTDAFRVAQRPLAFVAPHANGAWRWPIQALQISGASLTATLGPPEK